MSSISSLSRAVSGLMSQQAALNTTAHNLSNLNTKGYVKQQVLFRDYSYITLGQNRKTMNQLGLGTDVEMIRQVRDRFLDAAYRTENGRMGFYESGEKVISELESIIGETEGETFSKIVKNLWNSLQELSKNPEGLETRGSLIQNAVLFAEKANLIAGQVADFQKELNTQISDKVDRINQIGDQILKYNELITRYELGTAQANDYRDMRNKLADELSNLVDIRTSLDIHGNMLVKVENVPFVTAGDAFKLGVVQSQAKSQLIEPYWPHLSEQGPPLVPQMLFDFSRPINPNNDNNKGALKGLILQRGTGVANYTDLSNATNYEKKIKPSIVMTVQAQFDNLVHGIVKSINDILSPTIASGANQVMDPDGPYGLNGEQGIELFSRTYMKRFDSSGNLIAEDPTNEYSLYSAGNIMVNKEVLADYNKICLSQELGKDGDNTIVQKILDKWKEPFSELEPGHTGKLDFNSYYNSFVSNLGGRGEMNNRMYANQTTLTLQVDNQRNKLMGVSSDEELNNMLKYQHAYNASARMVTVIDQMIGRLIDQTGLAGR